MHTPKPSLPAILSLLALASACTGPAALRPGERVPFPEGWRDWRHVKSMVIQPGHALHESFGGIHHVYGNPAAIAGLRSGRYADGAVFAFDLLAADDAGNAIVEGGRKVLGVMHKDATAFPTTGGWGFAGFDATRRDVVTDMQSCFQCHLGQRGTDYVFSRLRD